MSEKELREVEFRPIPGFPDYAVSREGVIKRITPRSANWQTRTPIITQFKNGAGYPRVTLVRPDKSSKNIFVHRAVALAWIYNSDPKGRPWVAHLDGNRANSNADNLVWASRKENESHKSGHGTRLVGEKVPGARLTADTVLAIRSKYIPYQNTHHQLADEFGIHHATVRNIVLGLNWKHIGGKTWTAEEVKAAAGRPLPAPPLSALETHNG